MLLFNTLYQSATYDQKVKQFVINLTTLLSGAGLSIMLGYLVAADLWFVGLGLILAVPGIILLYKYPLFGLGLWLLLTPFLVASNSSTVRKVYWVIHRALPVATIGMILLNSYLQLVKRKLPKLGWPELAMAGYILASVFSIVFTNDDVWATLFHFYDRVFIPMSLYLLVRLTTPDERDLKRLMPIVIFILVTQSIIGILSWVMPSVLPSAWLNRVGLRTTGSLRAYSVFSTTMIFAGLLLLQDAMHQKRTLIRFGYISLFILSVFMVFLSFSRGSWLAGMLVIMGLIYLYPRFVLRLILFATFILSLALGSGLLNDQLSWASQRLYSDGSEESALSRLPIYYAAYRMFQAKPLSGWGYGNFDRYDRQFQERVGDLVNAQKDHASHNVYLTLISEQGIIGFTLFLSPMFWWLIKAYIFYPNMPDQGFWGRKLMVVFWLVIIAHITVNNFSNMRVVFGLGIWWITLGLIANYVSQPFTGQRGETGLIRNTSDHPRQIGPTGAVPLRIKAHHSRSGDSYG